MNARMMFARVVVGAMMPCLAGCEGPGLVKCPARQDVETHFVAMVTEGDEYMDAALESKMPMLSFGPPATLSDALDFFEDSVYGFYFFSFVEYFDEVCVDFVACFYWFGEYFLIYCDFRVIFAIFIVVDKATCECVCEEV